MTQYERPLLKLEDGIYEGVYMASGDSTDTATTECQSIYLNGVFRRKQNGSKHGLTTLEYWGCQGCPFSNPHGCSVHENTNKNADARPAWERQGQNPSDPA
ncbi:MAG: hypothetical protein PWP24_1976 [Clostridiales bacterium]|nr:hypothetical protein [Clostridiales bacterium]